MDIKDALIYFREGAGTDSRLPSYSEGFHPRNTFLRRPRPVVDCREKMWSWFGGASAAQKRKDAPKNAILLLREQLDMLQKREKHLENQMAEQDAVARKNVSTNKNGMALTMRIVRLHFQKGAEF